MINEVLKGITDALYAAFGDDYEIHTEASMQDMEEPAFFVRCINPDVPRGLTGRRKATLLFIVQYFPESDEPKKEINTVYERLSECLDLIEVEGKMVRGTIEWGHIGRCDVGNGRIYVIPGAESERCVYGRMRSERRGKQWQKQLIKLLIPKSRSLVPKNMRAGWISCRHYWNRENLIRLRKWIRKWKNT